MASSERAETFVTASEQAEAWIDWLRHHRGGALLEELARYHGDVVMGVTELAEPGNLTVKITVKPIKGATEQVHVEDKLTVTVPQDRGDTAWVGRRGVLTFREARQAGFKLLRDGSGVMPVQQPPPAPPSDDDEPRERRDLQ